MGGLKKILAQNFKDASGLKAEGNDLMRSGRLTDAIRDLMLVVFHDFCPVYMRIENESLRLVS